jgi:phage tail-like protein
MPADSMVPGFRFGVFFLVGGLVPNPIDIRFQRVSGLNCSVQIKSHREGGQNLYSHRLPEAITYDNLVLERGMVVGSPLTIEFNTAMSQFKFAPSNVLVTVFSEDRMPVAGWLFIKAYPVRWATSDLDAGQTSLLIDTLELAYTRMQMIRI